MPRNGWLLAAGVLLLLALTGGVAFVVTRGFRNNNPGNLIDAGILWQGMVGRDPQGFVIFDTMENGVRAMAKDLLTGFKRGEDTLREIISAYAPAHENPTDAYTWFVADRLGVDPDQVLSTARLPELVAAIIRFENGKDLSPEVVTRGVKRAYA